MPKLQSNHITLIISTSWSTPLSPGNRGCRKVKKEKEAVNSPSDRVTNYRTCNLQIVNKLATLFLKLKKKKKSLLPVQAVVQQEHNQQTICQWL